MSGAVKHANGAARKRKWWAAENTKNLVLLGLSVVSTTALFFSNLEGIMSFVQARLPGALASQFPFVMQIASTDDSGVQKTPFYREEHIQAGTLISAVRRNEFGLPALDFRIVNNSTEATLIREVTLTIKNSQPDNRPVLTWAKTLNLADAQDQLTVENDGWGAANDAKIINVVGTLIPKGGDKRTTEPFELPLGKIQTKSRDVSLPSLIKEKFKIDKLSDSDSARLSGALSYSYIDANGATKPVVTPFLVGIQNRRTKQWADIPAEGPSSENEYRSIQSLDTHRQNYTISCPVSANLEPKKAYRFIITLCSKQSAVHDFDVSIALSNGANIRLGHYRLEFYLPRNQAAIVSQIDVKPQPVRFTSIDGANEDSPTTDLVTDLVAADLQDTVDPVEDEPEAAATDDDIPSPGAGPPEESAPIKASERIADKKEPKSISKENDGLKALKASYPYGRPVPDRSDIVESPFLSGKYIDVKGFDHNAVIQDPYVHQLFLVP